jgi:hypothetical protein
VRDSFCNRPPRHTTYDVEYRNAEYRIEPEPGFCEIVYGHNMHAAPFSTRLLGNFGNCVTQTTVSVSCRKLLKGIYQEEFIGYRSKQPEMPQLTAA